MSARVVALPDRTRDSVLLGRARFLAVALAEACGELEAGIAAEDADLVAAAGRKLASVGWLFRDAADRRDRGSW